MSARFRRGRALLAGIAALTLLACAKPESAAPSSLRVFLGDRPVALVHERWTGNVVERESHLTGTKDDVSRLKATLDESGFVLHARYERRSPRGSRDVTLLHEEGVTTLRTPHGSYVIARDRPVVFLETLHHVVVERTVEVAFVDITAGEALLGSVRPEADSVLALDEHGVILARASRSPHERIGPGRFVERAGKAPPAASPIHPPASAFPGPSSRVHLRGLDEPGPASLSLDGPGQRAREPLIVELDRAHLDTTAPEAKHSAPAPFLESAHEAVRAFAERHARAGSPAADALALAEAIHQRLDTRGGGGPPSAVRTLSTESGDCDDATALLVAALRARGHPARPVVGYRHYQGELVPHAWAEVHDGRSWLPVDALVPGLGPFSTHLRLFEGLGSSLTMGRVLGALRIEPAFEKTREVPAR